MQLKYFFPQDGKGAVLPFAEATVYNRGTTVPSTIYDANGSQISNPVQADQHGRIEFRAADGEYEVQFSYQGELGQKVPVDFVDTGEFAEAMEGQVVIATQQAQQAGFSAEAAGISASSANNSKTAAQTAETNAKTSETNSKTSETNSKASETAARTAETNAKASETASKTSETNAKASEEQSEVFKNAAELAQTGSESARDAAVIAQQAAEAAAENAGNGGSVDLTNYLRKDDNLESLEDPTEALANLSGMSKPDVDGIASFAVLRTRRPKYKGERVYLKEYTENATLKNRGGGWFTGRLTAQADDGGYVASAGSDYHWIREVDLADLNVEHFGAVPDRVTDASPAVKRMYEFMFGTYSRGLSDALSPYLGVQFGAGTYFMSPLELTTYGNRVPNGAADAGQNPSGYYAAGDIRFMGVPVKFGKQIITKIISDKSDNPVITINHRRFTIHGIAWDGQQTTDQDKYNSDTNPTGTGMLIGATFGVYNDTASNKQPFFKNLCPGGTYANVSCFSASNTGSYSIYYLDSLDSRFDQIYGSKFAGPVLQVGWSDPLNQWTGKWDHSTAIEISNCNFQTNCAPALWIPRHGQGIIRNVWIEHGTTPLDINNGQWLIDMLCIEDCRQPAVMWNSRIIMSTYSAPTGVQLDRDSLPGSATWASYPKNPDGSDIVGKQSTYEMGMLRFENYGAYLDAPLRYKYLSGVIRGTNNTGGSIWMNLGSFKTTAVGGGWEIEIISRGGYTSIGTPPLDITADRNFGKTIINIQRGSGTTPIINMYHFGSTAILGAKYQSQAFNDILPALWLNINSYCGEYSISIKATGTTRLEAGECSLFNQNGATQTTSPGTLNDVEGRFSIHNGSAGFGAQGNIAAIKTTREAYNVSRHDMSRPTLIARMNFNGQVMAVPIYGFIPQVVTPPASQTIAVGSTLNLSVTTTDAVTFFWQKSTDGGTTWTNITGATNSTYTKANVTADDAGMYHVVIRGNNGSGGASTDDYPAQRVVSASATITVT